MAARIRITRHMQEADADAIIRAADILGLRLIKMESERIAHNHRPELWVATFEARNKYQLEVVEHGD